MSGDKYNTFLSFLKNPEDSSEFNFHGSGSERADRRLRVLQVIDSSIAVVLVVHRAKGRISVQHGLLHFHARVLDEGGVDAEPLLPVIGADGHLRIDGDLPGDGLHMAGLDIQFSVDDLGRAEGTNLRSVAVNRGKEIDTCLFQEIANSLHRLGYFTLSG